ncbi:MAG: response regulator [Anaerolineae bacterium]|nr:response regulator [Anaerolineae bacterium]
MQSKQILIIEDNADNRELVKFLLSTAGFTVDAVANAMEALAWLKNHHPDLILLDMSLPQIDGWQLAQQLKADPLTADIKLVALTAHTLPGDRKRALDAGCDGFISKPLDVPNFARTVGEYLQ